MLFKIYGTSGERGSGVGSGGMYRVPVIPSFSMHNNQDPNSRCEKLKTFARPLFAVTFNWLTNAIFMKISFVKKQRPVRQLDNLQARKPKH